MKLPEKYPRYRRAGRIAFALSLLFAFTVPSNPQSELNLHQWSSLSLFNGLPSNSVRAIAQTDDGVMWFGTDGGLARLDALGIQKVALGRFEGPISYLLAISNVLVGVSENGAFVISNGEVQAAEGLGDSTVNGLSLTKYGTTVAADDGIYQSIDGQNPFHKIAIPKEPEHKYTALGAARDGSLMAGIEGRGLIGFNESGAFPISSRPYFVNAIAAGRLGGTWIGANTGNRSGGLFLYSDGRVTQTGGSAIGTVTSIAADEDSGRVWVGTEISGLYLIEGTEMAGVYSFASTAGGLRSNTIYSVFVDRENIVWVGGDRGISRLDTGSPENSLLSEDSATNFVRVLFEGSGDSIFSGTNKGLFRLEGSLWEFIPGFAEETIYSIAEDPEAGILLGTRSKLATLDGRELLQGDIRGVGTVEGRTVAAVFGRGLVRIGEPDEEQLVFDHKVITATSSDQRGLMLGTGDGRIFAFDSGRAAEIPGLGAVRGSAVWSLRRYFAQEDPAILLVATEKGVFVRSGDKLEHIFRYAPSRDAVLERGEYWIATLGKGLVHIKTDDLFGRLQSAIGTEQGLPSDSVFSLLMQMDGRLLVATTKGISRYVINRQKPIVAPVRLLGQRLYSPNEMETGVVLDYPQNSLALEVGGLSSRTFPELFQYGFLLLDSKGNEIQRQISGDPQFLMDGLEAGDYTVQAFAFNQDLVRSDPLTFRISVAAAPFPWTSTALAVLLAVALIALIWAVVERHRITGVNRKLTEARLDLANEAERERSRIARDLHDQTLADLRNLMLQSDRVAGEGSGFRGEIEVISEEIRRICEDLSPSVLENVGLFASLEFLLAGSGLETGFEVKGGSEEELGFPPPAQIQVFRIAQEVISNITRHAEAGRIDMRVSADETAGFLLEIEDDGTAEFDAESQGKAGMGLSNIRSRASLIGATAVWNRKPSGGGCVFSLHKPFE
ncbi:MAG TPA: two-component regulator propeller domain-containing protein [Aridibacter sp.]|nr:two-component regulator propeller domain-containing protein [Aridibacter sp.]